MTRPPPGGALLHRGKRAGIAKGKTRMVAPDSAVLAYWGEHRAQLRQSESQRAVLANYVLAVTIALSGLVAQQRFSVVDRCRDPRVAPDVPYVAASGSEAK
jgi:hypothetical protein